MLNLGFVKGGLGSSASALGVELALAGAGGGWLRMLTLGFGGGGLINLTWSIAWLALSTRAANVAAAAFGLHLAVCELSSSCVNVGGVV